MPDGLLRIFNVGAGDMSVRWDHDSPEDQLHARALIEKLLRDGYAILVQKSDGSYVRATGFDADADAYIVGERQSERAESGKKTTRRKKKATTKAKTSRKKGQRIPRFGTSAAAIARSAGG